MEGTLANSSPRQAPMSGYIDSHQHFWNFDRVRDTWITDEMLAIRRNFLPSDLQPLLQQNNISGCVLVQSDQSEVHNNFMLELAADNDFIKGVVGWVDLRANNIRDRLEYYRSVKIIKGFRHVLQGETDRDIMLTPAFMNGIKALGEFGYTYDILIFPDQLPYTRDFVAAFPEQNFVIDHIAKPLIKEGIIDDWKKDIVQVSLYENVYCKLSGMATEADLDSWKKDDLVPYLDVVVEAFGPDRIMFGSDWPVCLVAASYNDTLGILKDYFSEFTKDEQYRVFGGNAIEFYGLQ